MTAAESATPGRGSDIFIGFDFGAKRIGAAVGDSLTGQARPLPALSNGRQPDWIAVEKLLRQWRPAACVVGLPVDLEGNEQPVSKQARVFANTLRSQYGIPVHLVDERLTSRSADSELREARADGRMNRRVKSGDRDGVAARLILEQWLSASASQARLAAGAQARPRADRTAIGESGRNLDPGFSSKAGREAEKAEQAVIELNDASPGKAKAPSKDQTATLAVVAQAEHPGQDSAE